MLALAESHLQEWVNHVFRGKDAYQVLRYAAGWALALRLALHVRRIAKREGLQAYLVGALAPKLKKLPFIKRRLDEEMSGQLVSFRKKFAQELTEPRAALPAEGMAEAEILSLMSTRKELDTKGWREGKITGAVYHGQQEHYDFISQVFGKWAFSNPLHPGIHPALRQMDSEVVRMIINLYNGGPECCGAFTTGGTESILMAMKAYRDWGRAEKGITEPNIVVCTTVHAAFDKAGKYFNILVRHARPDAEMRMDLGHMRSLMDSNTVAIVGSCCQYASGSIDPIEEMAKIALRKNVGLHVDACLGGFLVPFMDQAGFPLRPFDFRVPGVTSISCDPHKYGFAPKGSSVVMFSSRELRHHMYCYLTNWSGGIYATPTMTGSRAGGPVAGTWAALCKFGIKGYVETTRQIVGAAKKIAEGVKGIDGLQLVGRPDVCVVAFHGSRESVNCYAVADCMQKNFGWELATCQNPPCVHMAVTLPVSQNAEQFVADLRECVATVTSDPESFSSSAGMYGMAASLPASFLEDAAATYLDAMTEAIVEG